MKDFDQGLTNISERSLQMILRNTVKTIEASKGQIFEVYEAARHEVDRHKAYLAELKALMQQTVNEVDALEIAEQEEKQRLARVSSNFQDYSEEKMRECYEAVKQVQVNLGIAREKEKQLRRQRDQAEIRFRQFSKTVVEAERLAMRIGSALGYLCSQLDVVAENVEVATKNQYLGEAMIHAQEEERFRLSREIHDGPAQDVANLLFETYMCERMIDVDPEEAKMQLQELRQHMKSCLKDIRQIIFDMRPMALDDLGLVSALLQLIGQLSSRGILNAELEVEGAEVDLPQHVATGMFRIVQEALNNIAHHASATKANVRVLFMANAVSVLVEDNGVGFNVDEVDRSVHAGIVGMEERARIIGVKISINSALDSGTKVHLRYALNAEKTASAREAN